MSKYDYLKEKLTFKQHNYEYYNIRNLDSNKYLKLPFTIRILLESLVRNYDDLIVKSIDIDNLINWSQLINASSKSISIKIPFIASRVLLQDFSSIPALVNFASIRDNISLIDENKINSISPLCSTDLVLDHAIVDVAKKIAIPRPTPTDSNNCIFVETGYIECPYHNCKTECAELIEKNRNLEFERSKERLAFLKWVSKSFKNILLIPPFNGISHQTNVECLARIVFNKNNILYPDTILGTDTHTSMMNALGVLSFNIGAIEAESAMLNQPYNIKLPNIIGFKLIGKLSDMVTSIDVTLAITKHLKQINQNISVSDCQCKFFEFFGEGCKQLTVLEREAISHMCEEYDSMLTYFPIDETTIKYLLNSGRTLDNINCIEAYLKAINLYQEYDQQQSSLIEYTHVFEFDLNSVVATCSGPKRAQDKLNVHDLHQQFSKCLIENVSFTGYGLSINDATKIVNFNFDGYDYQLKHGSIVIASIANYTNTSNPSVLLAAGLLAKKAYELGLKKKPYVKTSLSPGSGLITKHYLTKSGMLNYLESFGFNIVGYGCSTCIENNNEISPYLTEIIEKNQLITVAVLSGNRNSENRINKIAKANYLISPALVVVYAITGTININFECEPIGYNANTNQPIYLKDVWPTRQELYELELNTIIPQIYNKIELNITSGNNEWNSLNVVDSLIYNWNFNSTYIKHTPFLDYFTKEMKNLNSIKNANVLIFTNDCITSDHISSAGSIPRTSTAAKYLIQQKVQPRDFNSYGSRRGNYEIMSRATFSNLRNINKLVKVTSSSSSTSLSSNNKETNSKTLYIPGNNKEMDIYEAIEAYKSNNIPLIIIAGENYGCGPSRDWAVKGQWMLGIKAIIAQSFDDEHRINLIKMGILPLKFQNNENSISLKLTGREKYTIYVDDNISINQLINVQVDNKFQFQVHACILNDIELIYFKNGGLLSYITRKCFSN